MMAKRFRTLDQDSPGIKAEDHMKSYLEGAIRAGTHLQQVADDGGKHEASLTQFLSIRQPLSFKRRVPIFPFVFFDSQPIWAEAVKRPPQNLSAHHLHWTEQR